MRQTLPACCCASTASGVAMRLAIPARNARRSITGRVDRAAAGATGELLARAPSRIWIDDQLGRVLPAAILLDALLSSCPPEPVGEPPERKIPPRPAHTVERVRDRNNVGPPGDWYDRSTLHEQIVQP